MTMNLTADEMDALGAIGGVMGFLGAFLGIMVLICIVVYVVNSLGWMKLYKAAGYEPAWASWVPFLNVYAMGMFLKDELDEKPYIGYIMAFYWAAGFIPFIGSIALLICAIFVTVQQCRWILKRGGGALGIVLLFLFPIALPYVMRKHYE